MGGGGEPDTSPSIPLMGSEPATATDSEEEEAEGFTAAEKIALFRRRGAFKSKQPRAR